MRNKTLAIFVVLALAVAFAVAQVPGVFSQISIGSNVVIPTGTLGYSGSGNVMLSNSPTMTGVPTAPTASPGTNTTQLATTAFVQAAIASIPSVAHSVVASATITSCTLADDGGGGSYCQSSGSWGTTISGSYQWSCTSSTLASAGSAGAYGSLTVNNVSSTSTGFTYFIDSRFADGRTQTVTLMCQATQ